MRFLNLGCGSNRPQIPLWTNIDNLHLVFPNPGCPERINMDREPNYLNHDLKERLPFNDNEIDGILCSHILEHMDIHEAVKLIKDCRRILKPKGILRVSVPDPERMLSLQIYEDNNGDVNWGEVNPHDDKSFLEFALFFYEHVQLISKECLSAMFYVSGFKDFRCCSFKFSCLKGLADLDNRESFSLFMEATK
jgi:predicted SAM-dependent methyltransferase